MTPPSTGWTVTSQGPPTTRVNTAGQPEEGITVYFRLGNGTESSIFVPAAIYNADNVRTMIADKAAALEAVGNLSAPSGS